MNLLKKRRALGLDPYFRTTPRWRQEAALEFYSLVNDLTSFENGQRLGFGLDTPDPTGDLRLVKFCHALPGEKVLRRGQSRRLVRESLLGLLPEKIRTRTLYESQGADLCLRMDPLRTEIGDILAQFRSSSRLKRYLDLPRLSLLWKTWDEREQSNSYPRFLTEQQVLARGLVIGSFLQWFDRKVRSVS